MPIAVGFLTGAPRQGRVGVGYAMVYGVDAKPAVEPSLTVADVDAAVAAVEQLTGKGSADARRAVLSDVLGRATAEEASFLRRLFTGELRQGALAGVMVDAVAKAAGVPADVTRRAYMLSGDLSRTAAIALAEGEAGLRAVGFELFRPVLPMLASPAETVRQAVESFELSSVEWKLDGIRIQIHRRGDEVRIYTRNLNDITAVLPGIADAVRRLPLQQAVLDGEAIWMGDAGPAAFQDTVARLDGAAPPEGIEDVPLRRAAPGRRRSARRAAGRARGQARCSRRRHAHPAHRSRATRRRASACSRRRWPPATRASS